VSDQPFDDNNEESSSWLNGPLLPPEDRIWRHPSEMAGQSHPGEGASTGGPAWGTAAFSAVGGALAVGLLWYAVGGGDGRLVTERVSLAPVHTVSPRVVEADEWGAAVTATARLGTASVLTGDEAVAGAVAYRDDGYLLTSARAVQGVDALVVVTADGVAHEARIVGTDSQTDVSVLHVENAIDPAVITEGEPLEAGDRLAIVDPAGASVESTVTDPTSHASTSSGDLLLGVVKLDTELGEVPPGSPVVDDTGAVVGIMTATDPDGAAAVVPIDIARQVAGELIDEGVATHSWLGVTARDLTAEEVESGFSPGALVTSLNPGGPADVGGVRTGDVIVKVGAKEIDSVPAMVTALRYHEPGDAISIVAVRDREPTSVVIVLGSLEGTAG